MCEVNQMATNLQIDDKLIVTATKLGGHRTKKSAVTHALTTYIQHLQQQKITKLFGVMEYDDGYDYKRQRTKA